MVTISLCMIVKNEEDTLGRCLDSIKGLVDEIIIVDTGSADRTKEIAREYTNKIYDFEWIDDFAAARNFSFSKATKEYILWLDADDVLLEEDRLKLKNLRKTLNPEIDVVMMKYNIGTNEKGEPLSTFYRERLLKRSKNFQWFNPVHEYTNFNGKIVNSDIAVTHKKIRSATDRNLRIFEKMLSEGKEIKDRNLFYYARELYINKRYDDAIVYYNKFLDTEGGLMSNYIDASVDMSKCYLTKDDKKNSVKALLRSFEHDVPRAEVCCQLGYHYKNANDFVKAISWFELVTKLKKPEISWGSVIHDCWGYIPCMELCSCYYKLGKIKEALEYVNKALEYRPGDETALHNKSFIEGVIQNIKQI
ncbi:MAG: glycosyltransferase [Clostridia bacterium]|nr:glycosyltransferase [Clostridia bacterium]